MAGLVASRDGCESADRAKVALGKNVTSRHALRRRIPARQKRTTIFGATLLAAFFVASCSLPVVALAGPEGAGKPADEAYTNPVFGPDFPDPDVVFDGATHKWYAFGTTDYWGASPSSLHILPILESSNLVDWKFVRNTFSPPLATPAPGSPTEPAWAGSVFLWAPEVHYIDGHYVMYYAASSTATGGSAIGVATASSPAGPWKDSGGPLIGPRPNPSGGYFDTIDPDEVRSTGGQRYLYYGSFSGGLWVVPLSGDGLSLKPGGRPVQVAAAGRYEGTSVVYHDGYYYLFASSGNCCAGPNTGYEEVVGRSKSPLGPFVDRLGIPLMQGGGTVVLAGNGNYLVGPGGGTVFRVGAGNYWLAFHVVPERAPYLPSGATARPLALEPIEWGVGGWPAVNEGDGVSQGPQSPPLALGDRKRTPVAGSGSLLNVPLPGRLLSAYSQDFDVAKLGPEWRWLHEDRSGWSLTTMPGTLTIGTAPGDVYQTEDSAKNILLERAPSGNFIAATKVALRPTQDYQQAGLLLWQSHAAFFRLTAEFNSGFDMTEWAKQTDVTSPYAGFSCSGYPPNTCPVYGSGFLEVPGFSPAAKKVGGSGTWTWLRIAKVDNLVTAYTSINGKDWSAGATYNLDGFNNKSSLDIGLIAVAAGAPSEVPAHFAYVHVYQLSGETGPAAGTGLVGEPAHR